MNTAEFEPFQKLARLRRNCVITEKIDGTNAQINILETGQMFVGSRNHYITPENDNMGFAAWVEANKEELKKLGPGRHFGEWYGGKIQRGYGLTEKRFALFNTGRWNVHNLPACCTVVPVLYAGVFTDEAVDCTLEKLRVEGFTAVPGFMRPEGIVVFHPASGLSFKVTLDNDAIPKSLQTQQEVSA